MFNPPGLEPGDFMVLSLIITACLGAALRGFFDQQLEQLFSGPTNFSVVGVVVNVPC